MGDDLFFYKTVLYRGGIPGIPHKTPKYGQKRRFWVPPPKNRVFGVQNARMACLVHLLFRIFRKNLSLIRGGGPPLGGSPHQRQTDD